MSQGVRTFWITLVFWLAACGGGGTKDGSPFIGGPVGLNHPRHFGFFGECITDLVAPSKHAPVSDLYYATGWCGPTFTWSEDVVNEARAAAANGYSVLVLAMPRQMIDDKGRVQRELQVVDAAQLAKVFEDVYLQWEDEPTTTVPERPPYTEAQIRANSAFVRTALPSFKLLGVYSCADSWAGLDTFDTAMCDHYHPGCNVLSPDGTVERFRQALGPQQKLWIIPPGADPWRLVPDCYKLYSTQHPVDAVVPFLAKRYKDQGVEQLGIDENGMWPAYCALGLWVLGRAGTC